MDDALVCLYQNGERVRPSNGYPIRLLLPGFEGNMIRRRAGTEIFARRPYPHPASPPRVARTNLDRHRLRVTIETV